MLNAKRQRILGLVALLIAFSPVSGQEAGAPPWEAVGERLVKIVREEFCSAEQAEQWSNRFQNYGKKAGSQEEFVALTRQALAELKTSHTSYHTSRDVSYHALLAIFGPVLQEQPVYLEGIGIDVTSEGFVRRIFAGGAAETVGLLRGDRILQADGKPFHPIESFQGQAGREITLSVQRQAGGPILQMKITPRRMELRQEWLETLRQGTCLIEKDGKQIGYIPIFANPGSEAIPEVRHALSAKLAQAAAVILDIRDGWGGCDPELLSLFPPEPPTLRYRDRAGKQLPPVPRRRPPLFVLINGGSRSSKEIVAFAVKDRRLGTLVGETTAGAVVGGRCFFLPDRSLLYLAVMDLTVNGKRLEGVGVAPDVVVPDRLPYAAGADPQLEAALRLAAEQGLRSRPNEK